MREFGLFNDEGMVEGQFYSQAAAEAAVADRYSPEDELEVAEVCSEHEEERAFSCPECWEEDES